MNYNVKFSTSLQHHGVQGQQWGVQHGPPYPLDSKISTGSRLKMSRQQRKEIKKSQKLKSKHLASSVENRHDFADNEVPTLYEQYHNKMLELHKEKEDLENNFSELIIDYIHKEWLSEDFAFDKKDLQATMFYKDYNPDDEGNGWLKERYELANKPITRKKAEEIYNEDYSYIEPSIWYGHYSGKNERLKKIYDNYERTLEIDKEIKGVARDIVNDALGKYGKMKVMDTTNDKKSRNLLARSVSDNLIDMIYFRYY